MRIDIWSDIICPFCTIGKKHLELALEEFEHAEEVEIHWHSFELDPNAPQNNGEKVVDMLAQKYGMPRQQAIASQEALAARAAEVGLTFNWQEAKAGNTFTAHRLIHAAREYFSREGVEKNVGSGDIEEAFMRAYFTDGVDISDPAQLQKIAVGLGMDAARVDEVLRGQDFADIVRTDEQTARQLGVTGVPFFLIDRKWALNGAQPVAAFAQALRTAASGDDVI